MAHFNFIKTSIDGLFVVEPTVFIDSRGFFMESYNESEFIKNGINIDFLQDNISFSYKNVLRGLHIQENNSQLVGVLYGEVFDVAVDVRANSKTYGSSFSTILSSENRKRILMPNGFAHGFYVISDYAIMNYKCSALYSPTEESGIIYNDPILNINWPFYENGENPVLSEKDNNYRLFDNKVN